MELRKEIIQERYWRQ